MPCRGPCGLTKDGDKNYDWQTPEAGCHLDDGHGGPHTWESDYGRSQAKSMVEAQRFQEVQITMKQLLCSACRALERLGYDMDENPALSQWWEQHKMDDAEAKSG